MRQMDRDGGPAPAAAGTQASQPRQWPVQIKLVPAKAPYFERAKLLIAGG